MLNKMVSGIHGGVQTAEYSMNIMDRVQYQPARDVFTSELPLHHTSLHLGLGQNGNECPQPSTGIYEHGLVRHVKPNTAVIH
eukprot:Gb_32391 [translate_table: standard]